MIVKMTDTDHHIELYECPKCKKKAMVIYDVSGENDHGMFEVDIWDCGACGYHHDSGGRC